MNLKSLLLNKEASIRTEKKASNRVKSASLRLLLTSFGSMNVISFVERVLVPLLIKRSHAPKSPSLRRVQFSILPQDSRRIRDAPPLPATTKKIKVL
jgi:hypothetical protein